MSHCQKSLISPSGKDLSAPIRQIDPQPLFHKGFSDFDLFFSLTHDTFRGDSQNRTLKTSYRLDLRRSPF